MSDANEFARIAKTETGLTPAEQLLEEMRSGVERVTERTYAEQFISIEEGGVHFRNLLGGYLAYTARLRRLASGLEVPEPNTLIDEDREVLKRLMSEVEDVTDATASAETMISSWTDEFFVDTFWDQKKVMLWRPAEIPDTFEPAKYHMHVQQETVEGDLTHDRAFTGLMIDLSLRNNGEITLINGAEQIYEKAVDDVAEAGETQYQALARNRRAYTAITIRNLFALDSSRLPATIEFNPTVALLEIEDVEDTTHPIEYHE